MKIIRLEKPEGEITIKEHLATIKGELTQHQKDTCDITNVEVYHKKTKYDRRTYILEFRIVHYSVATALSVEPTFIKVVYE